MVWTEKELLSALRRWEQKLERDGRTTGTVATYVRDARAFVGYLTGSAKAPVAVQPRVGGRSRVRVNHAAPGGDVPVPRELRGLFDEWTRTGSPAQRGIIWPRDRWVGAFPEHKAMLERLPPRLDRETVRSVAVHASEGPDQAREAFVLAFTWGLAVSAMDPTEQGGS